ncbi:MAG: DUF1688 family protein [Betaproteobacteria bacterium]|nr:DUF1688 family protein [Betaproteobacteria bacterium]
MNVSDPKAVVAYLRKLSTIRERCSRLYDLARSNALAHFTLDESKLDSVVAFVENLIRQDYPTLDIPFHSRWRHFGAGGIERHLQLQQHWHDCESLEVARRHIDLVVVSVLLDAGAGPDWAFYESQSGEKFSRSEGLGVASFWMFAQGSFSSESSHPHQVDAAGLARLKLEHVEQGFQITQANPLVGLQGRVELLQRLGQALLNKPEFFERNGTFRPGNMIDALARHQGADKTVPLVELWKIVIEGFNEVWPTAGRLHWGDFCLGDVWHHSALGGSTDSVAYIPFHKLSQWLTYSLLEPLACSGFTVSGLSALTGLPEYRNGGLFLDFGVLTPRQPEILSQPMPVNSEWIVEWRALTVMLLDQVAERLRLKMGKSEAEFPLAKVLEGGTWKAGRRIAAQRRPGGLPPVQVISDGTVF